MSTPPLKPGGRPAESRLSWVPAYSLRAQPTFEQYQINYKQLI